MTGKLRYHYISNLFFSLMFKRRLQHLRIIELQYWCSTCECRAILAGVRSLCCIISKNLRTTGIYFCQFHSLLVLLMVKRKRCNPCRKEYESARVSWRRLHLVQCTAFGNTIFSPFFLTVFSCNVINLAFTCSPLNFVNCHNACCWFRVQLIFLFDDQTYNP